MTREKLETASKALEQAATSSSEHRQRIEDQSRELMELAERDADPDQGRLDRHMNILRELRDATDDQNVERAFEHVREYRTGVGGI